MKRAILGESVRGASHERNNLPCQDSMRRSELPGGAIILAAADGHGSPSCPYSRSGANTAVNVFCRVMEDLWNGYQDAPERLLTYLNREGDTRIAKNIEMEWKRRVLAAHTMQKRPVILTADGERDRGAIYQQYGTTLLGMLITPVFYFAFQVGDGDILYLDHNGVERIMAEERILGTETHSLSHSDAWRKAAAVTRRRIMETERPSLFWLSTDGFSNSYRSGTEFSAACAGYFEALLEHGPEAVRENLKSWLAETSTEGCGDDITVLMCYDVPDDLPPEKESPVPIEPEPLVPPEESSAPVEPETPVPPEESSAPVEPEIPVPPEESSAPVEPETPVPPEESPAPVEPEILVLPEESSAPVEPEIPVLPEESSAPVEPETPVPPEESFAPVEPETPVPPEESSAPMKPEIPVPPEESSAPMEPEPPVPPEESSVPIGPELSVLPEESPTPVEPELSVLPEESPAPVEPEIPVLPEEPPVPMEPEIPPLSADEGTPTKEKKPRRVRKPRPKIVINCEELLALAEQEDIDAYLSAYTSLENCGFPVALTKKISRLIQKLTGFRFALEKHPEQAGDVQRFFSYYVPEGIRLAVSYYEYQNAGVPDQVMKKLYGKIVESIDTLNAAIEKKLLDIYRFDAMDTGAKADALRQILEQDGYSRDGQLFTK